MDLADIVQIDKVSENFRILYNVKGRFLCHRIPEEEANFKLCKVTKKMTGPKNVPIIITSDARTIRHPVPLIRINDTIVYDLMESKIDDFMSLEPGNLTMVTGGRNLGRIGVILARDHHAGGFDIVRFKDATATSSPHGLELPLRDICLDWIPHECTMASMDTSNSTGLLNASRRFLNWVET